MTKSSPCDPLGMTPPIRDKLLETMDLDPLGAVQADPTIPIHREEVAAQIVAERKADATP